MVVIDLYYLLKKLSLGISLKMKGKKFLNAVANRQEDILHKFP